MLLRILCLGFLQDGAEIGIFLEVEEGSLWQAHAFQQIDVTRVGAQRIHSVVILNAPEGDRFVCIGLLQPREGLILIPQCRVQVTYTGRILIASRGQLFSQLDIPDQGSPEPRLCIDLGDLVGNRYFFRILCEGTPFLPLLEPQVVLPHKAVRQSKVDVPSCIVWVDFEQLPVLLDPQIVLPPIHVAHAKVVVVVEVQGIQFQSALDFDESLLIYPNEKALV